VRFVWFVFSPLALGNGPNGIKELRCTCQRQAAFQPGIISGNVKTLLPVDIREEEHFLNDAVGPIEKSKKRYI
jgi:hypothetical protein